MTPLVSVITPMYNAEKFIAETIESVLAQTYENWEMLVVDNFSTDGCRELVLDYAKRDARIRLIKLDFNSGGPARPRNIGINCSRGDFIAFVDADDLWKAEKLERQVDFMLRRPEIGFLYGPCLPMIGGVLQEQWPLQHKMMAGHVFEELFLSHNVIPCSSVMVRKNSEIPLDFDEDSRMIAIEDFDLWLRIARVAAIGFMTEPMVIYRMHEANLSGGVSCFSSRYFYLVRKWRTDVAPCLTMTKYGRLIVMFSVMYIGLVLAKARSFMAGSGKIEKRA